MKTISKTLLGLAMASLVSTASAGVVSFNAAYGVANANAAAAALAAGSYGGITETFDGAFTSVTGETGAVSGSNKQGQWVNGGAAFETRVGTFTMTSPNTASNGNVRNDLLMIENNSTGEFGRQNAYTSQWLDSNDAKKVTWEILDGYNAFGFYLTDANDNGGKLRFIFSDGSATTLNFDRNQSNGNMAYITLVSDTIFSSVELLFDNNTNSADGWGIDNVTLAKVPEPGTLALLGLGLAGLAAARRRKTAA